MFIMENVWKSIYFQPTLCERPLLPFYQLGNLSCQFHQGAKMKRWLRGGSHKAMVKKVCHRPTEVFYDFWPIVLFGRICVFSVTIAFLCTLFKYLQSQSQCVNNSVVHSRQLYIIFSSVTICICASLTCCSQSATFNFALLLLSFQVWQCVSGHLVWTSVLLLGFCCFPPQQRVTNIVNNQM